MEKKRIEVQHGNVVVRIHPVGQNKNGRVYTNYFVSDYTTGRRKQWSFACLDEAKAKAEEIARAITGGPEGWEISLRLELRKAMETIRPTGMSMLPAAQLFAQAVAMLGSPGDLLSACDHWKRTASGRSVVAKSISEAVAEFQASRQRLISFSRHKTESTYFNAFKTKFGSTMLHQLEAAQLEDWLNEMTTWGIVTRNDFLTSVSALYRYGHLRRWAPADVNPAKAIKRRKHPGNTIAIFDPAEAEQMFARLSVRAPELVPFLALWCFAGIRKDEVARTTWPQVNQGLASGYIELTAAETKTGEGRVVPVTDNLRAWLTSYRKDSGTVVPKHWLTPTKTSENRMNEISRFIARKTKIKWKENGPRHSFGTYLFKLKKDPGEVTMAMGTSLQKFQKHYWSKSRVVTEEAAVAWFNIRPALPGKVVPLPVTSTAVPLTNDSPLVSNVVAGIECVATAP